MAGASKMVKRTAARAPSNEPLFKRPARAWSKLKRPSNDSSAVAGRRPLLSAPVLTVRVGTDCSGLDTVITSLESLNVQADHVFSCERNNKLRDFIAAQFSPPVIYSDMKKRDNKQHNPNEVDLDFYVVGLACQPFSKGGQDRRYARQG